VRRRRRLDPDVQVKQQEFRRHIAAIKPKRLEYCQQCSTAIPSHRVCPKCGHYMGRAVIKTEE
jgi:large subunit ribosomal protein L32